MSRPFPWLPRLNEIRRTLANSVRSHYSRRELELLFAVSPRAAGRLLELLATEPIGTAHLVNRDALTAFLEQVANAADVPALCEQLRVERANLTRVKARYLLPRDQLAVPVASLPAAVQLQPGALTIAFDSLENLCARLMQLVQAMADDPVAFERICDPPSAGQSPETQDALYIQAEIERMDAELARRKSKSLNKKKPPP